MSLIDDVRVALRYIESNANEMTHMLIESGYPVAAGNYAKNIAASLGEIDRLVRPPIPPPILNVTDP